MALLDQFLQKVSVFGQVLVHMVVLDELLHDHDHDSDHCEHRYDGDVAEGVNG